ILCFIKAPKDHILPAEAGTDSYEAAHAKMWALLANYSRDIKARIRPITVNYSYEFLFDDEDDCIYPAQ
ncbi:MAG: hypothetical protein JKY93_12445, partial [Gammaproteobacteria bacterium]|nr:hypothetical protein [Gammaproteobacteria bacterium]